LSGSQYKHDEKDSHISFQRRKYFGKESLPGTRL
jgi:hypothetical protein